MEKLATQSGSFIYKHDRRLNPSGAITHLSQIEVAPKGFWGLRCVTHGEFVKRIEPDLAKDKYHKDMFKCSSDGEAKMQPLPVLLADDVSLVQTPSEISNRSWWHVTREPLEALRSDKLMHLGSLSAAFHRAVLLKGFDPHNKGLHLYKFQLDHASKIENRILIEATQGLTVEELFKIDPSPGTPRIHRYINVREAPGSISLLIDAGVIKHFVETPLTGSPLN
ncbi:hypothetical protein LJ756_01145 [Arthrobacter sp. zg-Y411]|uniref:hypothetical protein n=1 Tax=Arthrobacter zhangbolii TaxID=2886936 RepID=UPI001D13553C|nr:hypothetical protein [Arthrobacter zhangbolii]MCC3293221.1 hypothetical protein [Arthrobacter zhangbolii]